MVGLTCYSKINQKLPYHVFRQKYEQFQNCHDLSQEWPTSWKDSTPSHHLENVSLNPSQLQFQELVYEMIWTERTYVNDLMLTYHIFAKDALVYRLLPKSLHLTFDNLAQIIRLHLSLLKDLRSRQTSSPCSIVLTVADLFKRFAPRFFRYYSTYFINFETSNAVITHAISLEPNLLGCYLRERSTWPECRNLTLQSFLLKPIQRLMKYPLFFKNLLNLLPSNDPYRDDHLYTLDILESVIKNIQEDKKENEYLEKLADLGSRISGVQKCMAHSKRRLIYEGYLTLVPSLHGALVRSVTKNGLGGSTSFTYVPHPNLASSRNTSLSLGRAPSKKVVLYVFLFNDVILCTRIRSKKRPAEKIVNATNYFGPTPSTLFKLVQPPGQLTFVDRSVSRIANPPKKGRLSLLGLAHELSINQNELTIFSKSQYIGDAYYEEHPQQFLCSIATQHITHYLFETTTEKNKAEWCEHLEYVLKTHVQRLDSDEH